jgi:hypothetical protein
VRSSVAASAIGFPRVPVCLGHFAEGDRAGYEAVAAAYVAALDA